MTFTGMGTLDIHVDKDLLTASYKGPMPEHKTVFQDLKEQGAGGGMDAFSLSGSGDDFFEPEKMSDQTQKTEDKAQSRDSGGESRASTTEVKAKSRQSR